MILCELKSISALLDIWFTYLVKVPGNTHFQVFTFSIPHYTGAATYNWLWWRWEESSHLFTISIKMPCFLIQRMLCTTFHTFGRWHKQKGSRWSHRGGANTWLRVLSLLRYQRPLKHNRKILNITNSRTALFSLFLPTEQQAKDVKGALFHFCIVHWQEGGHIWPFFFFKSVFAKYGTFHTILQLKFSASSCYLLLL